MAMDHLCVAEHVDGDLMGYSGQEWKSKAKFIQEAVKIDAPNFLIADHTVRFCETTTCYAGRNGVSYAFDDHHKALAGANIVVETAMDVLSHGK